MTGVVTIADCRAAGYCVNGSRRRCRDLGIDFRALMTVGIRIEELRALKDRDVDKCIAKAMERQGTENV